jgi:hypothetical protein
LEMFSYLCIIPSLPLQVEEGLCQLMALLWIDRQHDKLSGVSEN